MATARQDVECFVGCSATMPAAPDNELGAQVGSLTSTGPWRQPSLPFDFLTA